MQIHKAVSNEEYNKVKQLISQNKDCVNMIDSKKQTPLHIACNSKSLQIVQLLLSK